jgi:hypothetical protein
MKKPEILVKLRSFFGKKQKHQESKINKLKVLLKKLKKEEVRLREKADEVKASRRSHYERQIKVLHEQRKKGVALRKELQRKVS